ncbi:MAG: S9 family peptidase, partial [Bacteroidota bacterium]
MRRLALGLVLALTTSASAQRPTLTIEQITQRPETWIGGWPGAPTWTDAGDHAYFSWNPQGELRGDSLFRVAASGGDPERVPADARRALPPRFEGWHAEPGAYDAAFARRVYAQGGDLYLLHLGDGRVERLTRTTARESAPRFLLEGSIVYREGDTLYRLGAGGVVEQLTDLREGTELSESDDTEAEAYLRDQQRRL